MQTNEKVKEKMECDYLSSYLASERLLKTQYENIYLVSHPKHLSKLPRTYENSLIVTSDWILISMATNLGFDVIHYEYGLRDFDPGHLEYELYKEADKWLSQPDAEKLNSNGVALGKLYTRDISLIIIGYARLSSAIEKIGRTFNPRCISLFDYRAEFGVLDKQDRINIVADACKKLSVKFDNRYDGPLDNDPEFPQYAVYGLTTAPQTSDNFSHRLYENILHQLSGFLSKCSQGRNAILVATNSHLSMILADKKLPRGWRYYFRARSLSKNPFKILGYLINGVHFLKNHRAHPDEVLAELNRISLAGYSLPDGIYDPILTCILRRFIDRVVVRFHFLEDSRWQHDERSTLKTRKANQMLPSRQQA